MAASAEKGKSRKTKATGRKRKPTTSRKVSNLKTLEQRRLRAAKMFDKGARQADVMRELGVSNNAANRWYHLWKTGGVDALRTKRPAGRPTRLTKEQLRQVEKALLEGAAAHGFQTELWTLERVAKVIEKITGVSYHPGHVWRVLRRLGWSVQKPTRRASERNQKEINRWLKEKWPKIRKNAKRRGAWIVFVDESGISTTPPIRRTWAPKGKTPVITTPFNWKRASMAGALCYHPDGRQAELVFQIRAGSYNDHAVVEFLDQLYRHLDRGKITLIWDGLKSHRSRKVAEWLASKRRRVVMEFLPAYAPELNPVEALWANLKGKQIANLIADTLGEAIDAAKKGITKIRRKRKLLWSFLGKPVLAFA